MIVLEHISKSYHTRSGEVCCLNNLTFEINKGDFIAIEGPSGCGKTTLLLMIGGMLHPSAGRVIFEGNDLYAVSNQARATIRARKIGFVFQLFHLVPYLNSLENVLIASHSRSKESNQRALELLKQLGLETRLKHKSEELSAGERQRTAIARALLNNPTVILADEPTGNLDPQNSTEVFRHLSDYHKKGGTVIVVTHGREAREYANRTLVLPKS